MFVKGKDWEVIPGISNMNANDDLGKHSFAEGGRDNMAQERMGKKKLETVCMCYRMVQFS